MKRLAALAFIFLCLCQAYAQESACPALQQAAFENIVERCAEQEASTVCLGQATVSPVLRGSMSAARLLNEPGDAIAIADIDWLSVSSEDRTWGVARALFPAYSGDNLEARDAALMAFGNVAISLPEPAPQPPILADVKVTAAQGANLRALPGTDARVIARLAVSRELKAIARNPDGGWLQITRRPNCAAGSASRSSRRQPSACPRSTPRPISRRFGCPGSASTSAAAWTMRPAKARPKAASCCKLPSLQRRAIRD